MSDSPIQWIAATLFVIALLHTFAAKQFERLSHRYPRHAGLFHLLGEVEVVFGFWAIVLVLAMALIAGGGAALGYAESRNYTEPLFVFVVMVIAGSRPVLCTVTSTVTAIARMLPVPTALATSWRGLAAVPLLGSLISGAMTQQAIFIFIYGLVMPGIDNYAHAGGFFGGYLVSRWLDPLRPERVDHLIAGLACLAISALAVIASVVFAIPLLR